MLLSLLHYIRTCIQTNKQTKNIVSSEQTQRAIGLYMKYVITYCTEAYSSNFGKIYENLLRNHRARNVSNVFVCHRGNKTTEGVRIHISNDSCSMRICLHLANLYSILPVRWTPVITCGFRTPNECNIIHCGYAFFYLFFFVCGCCLVYKFTHKCLKTHWANKNRLAFEVVHTTWASRLMIIIVFPEVFNVFALHFVSLHGKWSESAHNSHANASNSNSDLLHFYADCLCFN